MSSTASKSSSGKIAWSLLGSCALLITMAIVACIIYRPPQSHSIILALSTAICSFAAIPLFLIGRRDFKHGILRAYTFICIGIGLFGFAQLQLPMVRLFGLWFLLDTGLALLPYIASVVMIFLGLRIFARLLHVRSRWVSPLWATITAIVMAFLSSFLPHVQQTTKEIIFDISMGLNIWAASFLFFAVMATISIKKAASTRYSQALNWMIASLGMLTFGFLHYGAVTLMLQEGNWYYDADVVFIPFILGALLFVKAGHAFTMVYQLSATAVKQSASPIDAVLLVASLASNPRETDVLMDRVRVITASHPHDDPLTTEQEKTLASVYQDLETYLVTKEALRRFNATDLRETVRLHFEMDQNPKSPFWSLFTV